MAELENRLRASKISQAMFPEVFRCAALRHGVPAEIASDSRKKDLTAVSRRKNPRDPIECRSEKVLVPNLGGSSM
jgi:hypothetical protein